MENEGQENGKLHGDQGYLGFCAYGFITGLGHGC